MTTSRIFAAAALACAASLAAAVPAAAATGPFTVESATRPQNTILVVDAGSACAAADAAVQAALAAQAGRAVGVVADASACPAARAVMELDAAPALAFAADEQALGPRGEPNSFLARNRAAGIYVWSMDAYRRLPLDPSRQVLGVFADETPAAMIEAALDRLSDHAGGYFLLVQADALDDAALAALAEAQDRGAAVIAPGLLREASVSR